MSSNERTNPASRPALRLSFHGLFKDFKAWRGDDVVARGRSFWTVGGGELRVGRRRYAIRPKQGSPFTLLDGQRVVASATYPRGSREGFEVEVGDTVYEVLPEEVRVGDSCPLGFTIRRDGREVGAVRRESPSHRGSFATVPRELTLEVQVFLIWLGVGTWYPTRLGLWYELLPHAY